MRTFAAIASLFLVSCVDDIVHVEEPKQRGLVNPMVERGQRGFDQRERDCFEIPNAAACYDVGMNYELGISLEPDTTKALEFYDRACELDHDEEHCEAAQRIRAKR